MSKRIAFVDPDVAELADLAGSDGVEVHVLSADRPVAEQMAQTLAAHASVSAVDLLSHGDPGRLQVAGRGVGRHDLLADAPHWRAIGQKIEPGGALFVYGCRVAAGAAGHDFVDALFELSQVSVAAASGPIGAARWGGSWDLDVQRGATHARPMALQSFAGLLATITGTAASESLTGTALADTISGLAGDDTLIGGLGIDSMIGGLGSDTYYVDHIGDKVVESAGQGVDWVFATVDFTLLANVEHLVLQGTAVNGTGNGSANQIIGNASGNNLLGMAGNDSIWGGGGNDTIDGGTGSDVMYGGGGDDQYFVDSSTDSVIEHAGEGTDRVFTALSSYTLSANVENLFQMAGAVTGSGNALNNRLTGNGSANTLYGLAGNDTLDGGIGADKLYGGQGNDLYYVDSAAEWVIENLGEGIDTVVTSVNFTIGNNVENIILNPGAVNVSGNYMDNFIYGNAASNRIICGSGSDSVHAGAGNDTINSGTGGDYFYFETALNAATNVDTIEDFFGVSDRIVLWNDIFTAVGSAGTLAASLYHAGAGMTGSTAASQGAGVYYNTSTGLLYYDADGFGGAASVAFAKLTGAPTLSNGYFIVQD